MIVLICQSRSGSTLLRQLVNALPKVYIQGENANFIMKLIHAYQSLKEISQFQSLSETRSAWQNDFILSDMRDRFCSLIRSFLMPNIEHRKTKEPDLELGFKEIQIGRFEKDYQEFETNLLTFREICPRVKFVFNIRTDEKKLLASHLKTGWFSAESKKKSQTNGKTVLECHLQKQALFFATFHQKYPTFSYFLTYEDIVARSDLFWNLFTFLQSGFTKEALTIRFNKVFAISYQT